MSALNTAASYHGDSWRNVLTIVELADVFNPTMQVCSWQRSIDKALSDYLDTTARHGNIQIREELKVGERARLTDLPPGEASELLKDDISQLAQILCDLVDCSSVGLRFASVHNAMCPKWHVDRVPIRLLCTYTGIGTEWLEDQHVDRSKLSDPAIVNSKCQRAGIGDVVLLKGALWQDNEGFGAIHRSPAISSECTPRLLLTADPIWSD